MMTYNLSALPLTYPSILITAILIGRLSLLSHIAASSLVAFACKPSLAKKAPYLLSLLFEAADDILQNTLKLPSLTSFTILLSSDLEMSMRKHCAHCHIGCIYFNNERWMKWLKNTQTELIFTHQVEKKKLPLSFIICLLCASSLWKRTCLHKKAPATLAQGGANNVAGGVECLDDDQSNGAVGTHSR